mmetsp:Transcript_14378/g.44872  ORF Transcript_14378/g.44872 Transcript_14378/m.44872 type:complete len:222 (+) Transcript_14378:406-1071(+)
MRRGGRELAGQISTSAGSSRRCSTRRGSSTRCRRPSRSPPSSRSTLACQATQRRGSRLRTHAYRSSATRTCSRQTCTWARRASSTSRRPRACRSRAQRSSAGAPSLACVRSCRARMADRRHRVMCATKTHTRSSSWSCGSAGSRPPTAGSPRGWAKCAPPSSARPSTRTGPSASRWLCAPRARTRVPTRSGWGLTYARTTRHRARSPKAAPSSARRRARPR